MISEILLSGAALHFALSGGIGPNATAPASQPPQPTTMSVGVGLGLPNPDAGFVTPQQKCMAKRAAEVRALRNAITGQKDMPCLAACLTTRAVTSPDATTPHVKTTTRVCIQTTIIRTQNAPVAVVSAPPCVRPVTSPITGGVVKVEGQVGSFRVVEAGRLPSGAYQAKVVVQLPQPALLTRAQQSAVIQAVQCKLSAALEERVRLEKELANVKAEMTALERYLHDLAVQRAALEQRLGRVSPQPATAPITQPAR